MPAFLIVVPAAVALWLGGATGTFKVIGEGLAIGGVVEHNASVAYDDIALACRDGGAGVVTGLQLLALSAAAHKRPKIATGLQRLSRAVEALCEHTTQPNNPINQGEAAAAFVSALLPPNPPTITPTIPIQSIGPDGARHKDDHTGPTS